MSTTEQSQQLWGGETTKAVENFQISGETVPLPVIHWLGRIKGTAAKVNAELELLDADIAARIAAAGEEVAEGRPDDLFPSAVHLAALDQATNTLLPALEHLEKAFAGKAEEFKHIVKAGRTHLMD